MFDDYFYGMAEKASVVVLCYNGMKYLDGCLKTLKKQTYQNCEVIVVDNNSSDGSADYVKKNYPWVIVIETGKNLGFSGGNNVGIKHALANGAEYIILLNQDTEVEENFIEEGVKCLKGDGVGACCPKIKFYGTNMIWCAGAHEIESGNKKFSRMSLLTRSMNDLIINRGYCEVDNGQYNKEEEISDFNGCAPFINRKVFEDVGFLDDRFFMYYEDIDFGVRILKKGYRIIYFPSTTVYHKTPLPWNTISSGYLDPKRFKYFVVSWLKFLKKHFGTVFAILYIPKLLTVDIVNIAWADMKFRSKKSLVDGK